MAQRGGARHSPLIRRNSRGADGLRRQKGAVAQQSFEVLPPEGPFGGPQSPGGASATSASTSASHRTPSYATAYQRKPTTRRVNLSQTTPSRELATELGVERPSTAKVRRSLDEAAQFGKEVDILQGSDEDDDEGDGDDPVRPSSGGAGALPSRENSMLRSDADSVAGASQATPSFERGLGSRGFLGIDTIEMIRCEIKEPVEIDPKTNTVTLTRSAVESIRDATVLSSLAATTGFAKAYTGDRYEEYLPTSVFLTGLNEEGLPREATIEEDVIVYSVDATPAATPTTAMSDIGSRLGSAARGQGEDDDAVGMGVLQWDAASTATPSQSGTPRREFNAIKPSPYRKPKGVGPAAARAFITSGSSDFGGSVGGASSAASTAGGGAALPSYMRGTDASTKRQRDLRREKREKVDAKLDEVEEQAKAPVQIAPRVPACATGKRWAATNADGTVSEDMTVDDESTAASGRPPVYGAAGKSGGKSKLSVADLTSRRMLSEDEENRVRAIEEDPRFDVEGAPAATKAAKPAEAEAAAEAAAAAVAVAAPVPLRPGEGYLVEEADAEAEEALRVRLRELKPGVDVDALLAADDVAQAAGGRVGGRAATTAAAPEDARPEKDREDRLREKAKAASLSLRPPEDYLTSMKQERALRAKLQGVNDRLSELYQKTSDDERTAAALRSVDADSAMPTPLSPGVLSALISAACKEQDVALPSPAPADDADDVETRLGSAATREAALRAATPRYVASHTPANPELDPLFSACDVGADDEPEAPAFLFRRVNRPKSSSMGGGGGGVSTTATAAATAAAAAASPRPAPVEADMVVEDADLSPARDGEVGMGDDDAGVDYADFQAFVRRHNIKHVEGLPAGDGGDVNEGGSSPAAVADVEEAVVDTAAGDDTDDTPDYSDFDAFLARHGIRQVEPARPESRAVGHGAAVVAPAAAASPPQSPSSPSPPRHPRGTPPRVVPTAVAAADDDEHAGIGNGSGGTNGAADALPASPSRSEGSGAEEQVEPVHVPLDFVNAVGGMRGADGASDDDDDDYDGGGITAERCPSKDMLREDMVSHSSIIDDINDLEDEGDILFINKEATDMPQSADERPLTGGGGTCAVAIATALNTDRAAGRNMFLSGDWDALLQHDADGTLYRPASRVGTPLIHKQKVAGVKVPGGGGKAKDGGKKSITTTTGGDTKVKKKGSMKKTITPAGKAKAK